MARKDVLENRKSSAELRSLVIQSAGGCVDATRLGRIVSLCLAASTIDDEECRKHMRAVHNQAADLYSDSAHAKWANGSIEGRNILRLQILRLLDLYNGRLDELAFGSA